MPYRAKEAIHTDVNPLEKEFTGKLLAENDASAGFVLAGKGAVISDADAEKFGLTKSPLVEKLEDGQARRENDERNKATYGTASGKVADIAPKSEAPKVPEAPAVTESNADEQPPVGQSGNTVPAEDGLTALTGIDARALASLRGAGLDTPEKALSADRELTIALPYVTEAVLEKIATQVNG